MFIILRKLLIYDINKIMDLHKDLFKYNIVLTYRNQWLLNRRKWGLEDIIILERLLIYGVLI